MNDDGPTCPGCWVKGEWDDGDLSVGIEEGWRCPLCDGYWNFDGEFIDDSIWAA